MFIKREFNKGLKWQNFAIVPFVFVLSCLSISVSAVDLGMQVHKTSDATGYSFVLSDSFIQQGKLRWGVAYTTLNEVEATWNNNTTSFDTSTVDIFAAYRFKPKTYGAFLKSFSWELQAGASVSVTDNKFTFDDFPDQEIVFSETGDVNFMAAVVGQFKLSKKAYLDFGYKAYPSFSEFGSQQSVFIGFHYRFGRQSGY